MTTTSASASATGGSKVYVRVRTNQITTIDVVLCDECAKKLGFNLTKKTSPWFTRFATCEATNCTQKTDLGRYDARDSIAVELRTHEPEFKTVAGGCVGVAYINAANIKLFPLEHMDDIVDKWSYHGMILSAESVADMIKEIKLTLDNMVRECAYMSDSTVSWKWGAYITDYSVTTDIKRFM